MSHNIDIPNDTMQSEDPQTRSIRFNTYQQPVQTVRLNERSTYRSKGFIVAAA